MERDGRGYDSTVRTYLTENGGVGEGQAMVVITHWEEEVRQFRLCEGSGGGVVGGVSSVAWILDRQDRIF